MHRRLRVGHAGGLAFVWAALVALIPLLTSCSGGQVAIPSELGGILSSFHIPDVSVPPGGDQPGPVPNTITGTLTEKLDEDNSDASGGLVKHTVFLVSVNLKLDPARPASFGIASYLDNGSTWTHSGQEHDWTTADQCQFATDVTTDYNGSGQFGTEKRQIEATTRYDVDTQWTLDFNATVGDAPGHTTVKDQGVDCHTEQGTDFDGPGIRCLAPWTAPAVFKFDVICDEGGLTVTGTLAGQ